MSDPIIFETASPRFQLPLLFAGQSQREVFINEALARVDALLHSSVEGTQNTPPETPANGLCWRVGSAPVGDWLGHAEEIACRQSGQWLFIPPVSGMEVHEQSTGQRLYFDSGWQTAPFVSVPSGGAILDIEARNAIAALITALKSVGILAQS